MSVRVDPITFRPAIRSEALGGDGEVARFWDALRHEATAIAAREPLLARLMDRAVLGHDRFEDALAALIGSKLADADVTAPDLIDLAAETIASAPQIARAAMRDLNAAHDRNPAYLDRVTPFLYFKGFPALLAQRVSHHLWHGGRAAIATHLHNRVSEILQVDIHPAARLGSGIFIDHATGVVIGETAVVDDDVSILQSVTLGGTGKVSGDRHPKIRRGVLIGAGAKVLGNITVGEGAKIGAGSIVLADVAPRCTVVGNPARPVGRCADAMAALGMDHRLPPQASDPGYPYYAGMDI